LMMTAIQRYTMQQRGAILKQVVVLVEFFSHM
jgi:hypothetical protein